MDQFCLIISAYKSNQSNLWLTKKLKKKFHESVATDGKFDFLNFVFHSHAILNMKSYSQWLPFIFSSNCTNPAMRCRSTSREDHFVSRVPRTQKVYKQRRRVEVGWLCTNSKMRQSIIIVHKWLELCKATFCDVSVWNF